MKIKFAAADGQIRVYECEDVTITYYTRGTVAFKDAHDKWFRKCHSIKEHAAALAKRAASLERRGKDAQRALVESRERLELLTRADRWWQRLVLLLPKRSHAILHTRREIRAAEREERIAEEGLRELSPKLREVQARLEDVLQDEVQPSIELSIRDRKRRQIKEWLWHDGDACYLMDDSGKTIDIYRWPQSAQEDKLPKAVRDANQEMELRAVPRASAAAQGGRRNG